MRTLKISLLVFILQITISAQWYQQNSGTTNHLFSVQFVNELIGWASTDLVIYKTMDGGQNWQFLHAQNPLNPIFQISFSSENVGWIYTWTTGPTILKTIDGGENWIPVYSYLGATEYIRDFEFINPDTGWIVGEQTISSSSDGIADFPVLFKETTNGGNSWMNKSFPPTDNWALRKIEAIDYMNLIVAGQDTLLKTTDGGNTWQKLALPPICHQCDFQFINMNVGWIIGYSNFYTLYKTTNGGVSWFQQAQPVYNFQFITSQIGWYTYSNQIYNSTNGGSAWTLQNSNTNNTLNDIFFINTNNGWAVGQNGTILYTPNGGIPVELISLTATANINEVTLNWSTATETNNFGFEILRFAQNDKWNKIGFVPGHGTTAETQNYTFTDNDVRPGKYQYKLKQIDYDGTFEYSQIVEVEISFVNKFSLSQNYPNPFNPVTKIKYSIPSVTLRQAQSDIRVTLLVYDLLGREIATLVNEVKPAGEYEVEFNGSTLPSGIYFYQLKAGQFVVTRKMVLMK